MRQYLELMRAVLERGQERADRTGVGSRSLFGWQMRFDLAEGFPLLTTKKLHVRSLFDFRFPEVELTGYDPHPPIPAPIAV